MAWTGYMAHLSETCDDDAPRLIVHAGITAANVHEAMRTEPIHTALTAIQTAPAIHLVDSTCISAARLVAARQTFAIGLVGPPREKLSWRQGQGSGFRVADFRIAWDANRAIRPRGKERRSWRSYTDKAGEPPRQGSLPSSGLSGLRGAGVVYQGDRRAAGAQSPTAPTCRARGADGRPQP